MKFPRWLTICLLGASILLPCVVFGWSWVVWPEKTMQRFLALVEAEKLPEAMEMMKVRSPARFVMDNCYGLKMEDGKFALLHRNWTSWFRDQPCKLSHPTLSDVIHGCRRIQPKRSPYEFIARRGDVALRLNLAGQTIFVDEDDF